MLDYNNLEHRADIELLQNRERVYITGHRHPDSDSVIAAIAYSKLKQRKGFDAIPCRLGPLNAETKYLLERFGFEEPMLFEDARSTLAEIELDPPITITPMTTIKESLEIMKNENKRSLAIVNPQNKLMGMVTKSDLAELGLSDTAFSISLLKETPTDIIAKTIDGEVLYDDEQRHFNGKVSVIAIAESRLKNYDLRDRLVIVGNDTDAQLSAIRKNAGILMVVWCDEVEEEVYELAREKHCPIIRSGHGTMNTTRYLYLSPPVRLIMKTDLISFNVNEFVEEVGAKMLKSRYRCYPVVDDENHLVGYVARFHILNQRNKKVIMVDHNEFSQSVKSIEKADLLEVIDHHRISDIMTQRPISFRNEIIGSTTSIIASIYFENQMSISKELAGLMLGAIISDTLKFKSPTTTEKDKGIATVLARIAEIDIETFAKEMFKLTSNIANRSAKDLIRQDIKRFEIDGQKVMIAQVIVYQVEDAKELEAELEKEMNAYLKGRNLDLLVMAFTSILENGSVFYSVGKLKDLVCDAFPNKEGELHSFQPDILSRKNQFVPMISRAIINAIG